MKKKENLNVSRNGNHITIHKMNHPSCVSSFLHSLQRGIRSKHKSFIIEWTNGVVYPDACVPIAGIIAYYKENFQIGFEYIIPHNSYLEHCAFQSPLAMSGEDIAKEHSPFDKIFRYSTSEQVAALTQAYVDSISRQTECAEGVLTGLIWCLNEVIDNVLLHSEATHGFVMAQYHQLQNSIAICVYDSGIGIYNSLRKSSHRPGNAVDAISLAIQEGVGDGKGQGNGLYGLYQIVRENNGSLTITSGSGSAMWTSHGTMKKFENIPYISNEFNSTAIDYRLNLNHNIDIQKAFRTLGGFDGFDIRIDGMIQDDDSLMYDIFSNSAGTATRESGEFLRNDIINTITRTNSRITLDFSGVKTVSSSFIDELIAKMIMRLGIINFNQLVRIINMNDNVRFLCERSVYMRIHDEWEAES